MAAQCNIAPSLFWEMTWRDFIIMKIGKERNDVNDMWHTRFMAYMTYAANCEKGKALSMQTWFPLPTDERPDKGPELTDEQLNKHLKNLVDRFSKIKN